MRGAWTFAALLVLGSACTSGGSHPTEQQTPGPASAATIPLANLPAIDTAAVLEHTKALSSDHFEGRSPGSPGEELTVSYLIDQFRRMGLKPGNPDGTYVQEVPLVGITPRPAPLIVDGPGRSRAFKWKDEVVAWTKRVTFETTLDRSELVFVGYGVVAPEYKWDDYKGLDVRGKTLVMLVGDPPVTDPAKPGKLDPAAFGGEAMTYYGRWSYKFEIAAEKGAAGALIVHDADAAGYQFDVVQASWSGEQFDLAATDRNMGRTALEGWLTYDAGRDLLRSAGQDFVELKKRAVARSFKPVPLGLHASMTLRNRLRNVASRNVVARLEGRDPSVKDEHVIYTAHWDHLGVGAPIDGDAIYNGAQDNATGTAGLLEIARVFTALAAPPRRSVVFLAVTAEEQGLLGSEHYAREPLYPLVKAVANINMDGLNVHGRTKDITDIGYGGAGASDLDDYLKAAAAEQKREIRLDPEPEKGFYFRSDHFSFAKRGVPALNPDEGVSYVGKPDDYGETVRREYTQHHYHKPSDIVRDDWDLSGAAEDLQLLFAVGYRVAEADRAPEWKPGSGFKARREAMQAFVKEVETWRAKHEADYTRDFVSLSGLFFLKRGENTIGSTTSADVALPSRVPASVGTILYQHPNVTFQPAAGVPILLNGKPLSGSVPLKSDGEDKEDVLALEDLTFWVHESGERRTIRIRDPKSDLAKAFAGFRWFSIDERYRVVGTFIKEASRQIAVPSLTGDEQVYVTEGLVEFTLDGEKIRMRPMTTRPGRLYFIFRDGTSGRETYEAARFLYADLKPDGTVVLDFNQAYNPPCAFNPFTTCPLPPPENRLKVRIPAGERAYAGHTSLPRASR